MFYQNLGSVSTIEHVVLSVWHLHHSVNTKTLNNIKLQASIFLACVSNVCMCCVCMCVYVRGGTRWCGSVHPQACTWMLKTEVNTGCLSSSTLLIPAGCLPGPRAAVNSFQGVHLCLPSAGIIVNHHTCLTLCWLQGSELQPLNMQGRL